MLTSEKIANCDLSVDVLLFREEFKMKAQGSEAKIYTGIFLNKRAVLKERFVKKYRHPDLDNTLTTERIKAEVRALCKCHELGIKCPAVYFADLQSRCIIMQELNDAISVKDYLKMMVLEDCDLSLFPLAQKIGEVVSCMHENDLVHGDLTTSNMLLNRTQLNNIATSSEFDLFFIDFGLSKRDATIEDKAVDLYVLERALMSSYPNAQPFFDVVVKSYTSSANSLVVSVKLEEVKQRGRKRTMVG